MIRVLAIILMLTGVLANARAQVITPQGMAASDGEAPVQKATDLINRVETLLKDEKTYGQGYRTAKAALSLLEAAQDPALLGRALHVAGRAAYLTRNPADAEKLWSRAVEVRSAALGPQHPDVARSLNNLGSLYLSKGQRDRALPFYERSLSIFEKSLGKEHPMVAKSLNTIGNLYYGKGDYDRTLELFKRSLDIRKRALGAAHPEVAGSLNNVATVYKVKGDLKQALAVYDQALTAYKKALGSEHPRVAMVLDNIAIIYGAQAQHDRAISLYERVLTIREKAHGRDHPSVAAAANSIAAQYYAKAQYDRARPHYERALQIYELVGGKEHPEVGQSLNNLANLHYSQGQYDQALHLYERASKIYEKALGKRHRRVAATLNNIAAVHKAKGQYERAQSFYKRALSIYEEQLGPEHPRVALVMDNIAITYYAKEQFDEALPLYERSLAIREKSLGSDHPDVARSLNNLAILYKAKAQYSRALPMYERALAIYQETLNKDHPRLAIALQNIGSLHYAQGDLKQALAFFRRTLAMRERTLGKDHPDVAETLDGVARSLWGQGQLTLAFEHLKRSARISQEHLRNNLREGTETDRIKFAATLTKDRELMVSFALSMTGETRKLVHAELAELLISGKGLASEATQRVAQNTRRQMALFDAIKTTRSRLSALAYRGDSDSAAKGSLTDRLNTLLRQQAGAGQDDGDKLIPNFNGVTHAMGYKDALIDFMLYGPRSPEKPGAVGPPALVAVVVRRGESPVLIDLGALGALEKKLRDFRVHLATPKAGFEAPAKALYSALFKPLESALSDAKNLVISPDGPLHEVAFGALIDQNDNWLAERFTIRQVTTARDLAYLAEAPFPPREEPLVLAAAQFNRRPDQSTTVVATRGGPLSETLSSLSMSPLQGTKGEADSIAQLLGLTSDRLGLGAEASEKRLRQSKGPQVLHIATHGFFLPSHQTSDLDPMLRSGLALAGFNERKKAHHEDDGVLTALDVSGLDLYGTELVVLSACETGLGDTQAGEGLFGLKRALLLAGARSQVLSLWKVDDRATQALMAAYYTRLKSGEDRAQALRQVQLDMLSGRLTAEGATSTDQRGATVATSEGAAPTTGQGWSHPYYWASFTLSGADGPIELSISR